MSPSTLTHPNTELTPRSLAGFLDAVAKQIALASGTIVRGKEIYSDATYINQDTENEMDVVVDADTTTQDVLRCQAACRSIGCVAFRQY